MACPIPCFKSIKLLWRAAGRPAELAAQLWKTHAAPLCWASTASTAIADLHRSCGHNAARCRSPKVRDALPRDVAFEHCASRHKEAIRLKSSTLLYDSGSPTLAVDATRHVTLHQKSKLYFRMKSRLNGAPRSTERTSDWTQISYCRSQYLDIIQDQATARTNMWCACGSQQLPFSCSAFRSPVPVRPHVPPERAAKPRATMESGIYRP